MERPQTEIISFIAKQLKYKILPLDALVDVCIIAYSTSEIVRARNVVIDAFERNIDYSQPRSTNTTSIRGDLFRICYYLKRFPCAVGQERQYTAHIKKRALMARLDGMCELVSGLCDKLKTIEKNMPSRNLQPGQCSNAADSDNHGSGAERQDNPLVQPLQMPINQELNMQEPAEPAAPEEIYQFPIEAIHNEPDRDAGLQVLSVEPPVQMLVPEEVRVDAPLPNPGQEGPSGNPIQRMPSPMNEDARGSTPSVEWVDSDLSSLSGETSNPGASETGASLTSDDDSLPENKLNSKENGSTKKQHEPQRQVPRPIAPPAQRLQFEGLPAPSQPIVIPTPIRLLADWATDEESPTRNADLEPPCSKRPRRMDRPE